MSYIFIDADVAIAAFIRINSEVAEWQRHLVVEKTSVISANPGRATELADEYDRRIHEYAIQIALREDLISFCRLAQRNSPGRNAQISLSFSHWKLLGEDTGLWKE